MAEIEVFAAVEFVIFEVLTVLFTFVPTNDALPLLGRLLIET